MPLLLLVVDTAGNGFDSAWAAGRSIHMWKPAHKSHFFFGGRAYCQGKKTHEKHDHEFTKTFLKAFPPDMFWCTWVGLSVLFCSGKRLLFNVRD